MRTRVFAVAAGAVVLVATAAPAVAAPAVDLLCQTSGSRFTCFTVGSTGSPTTVTWTRDGVHVPDWDDRGFFLGQCALGEVVTIAATVTDPTGSATADDAFPCNTGPWPERAGAVR